jgi:hypothetical protein
LDISLAAISKRRNCGTGSDLFLNEKSVAGYSFRNSRQSRTRGKRLSWRSRVYLAAK